MRQSAVAAGLAVMALSAAGCQSDKAAHAAPPAHVASSVPTTPVPSHTAHKKKVVHVTSSATITRKPAAFSYRTAAVTASQVGKSWHSGCPLGPSSLTALTLTYWGFDHASHSGTLVVNRSIVPAVVAAFKSIYVARFPIRRMVPIAAYGGSDDKSMAADNTSAFNCRRAVSNGPPSWSMHAYGEAIDLNPLENPYRLDGKILPPAGAPYMNRSDVRPGMVVAGSAPVAAFAAVHWGWGGNWSSTPDYQHFSVNGR
ncbi:MAG TPA: M15 family metallopeptidase [Mycobacteriales bacterium]|jgi:hypothetical protein|nr:M15 family metallopeptidase [Mycobacteriales bacterium]